eukprot:TRINITY_DN30354_c0_g1_i1.p1 TRINITY_DN30354_c0_g1~~TRINITY_DN30354_c0_g1_i1.p1  ORF type:complete len:993 (+),score=136.71 TRINITY_DN30354_c0_g1_i1:119-2980(+)
MVKLHIRSQSTRVGDVSHINVCGDDGRTVSLEAAGLKPEDSSLCKALKGSDIEGTQNALEHSANVKFDRIPTSLQEFQNRFPEFFFEYKQRTFFCQPLHLAVLSSEDLVGMLLKNRAEIGVQAWSFDYPDGRRGVQAIHLAAGEGSLKVLQLLLESKADVHEKATIGTEKRDHYLPIHDAAWFGRVHHVDALLRKRALATAENSKGQTALHLAAELGYVELVEMLVGKIPPCSGQKGDEGILNPSLGRVCSVTYSPESGASEARELLKIQDNEGNTPLACAALSHVFPQQSLHLFTYNLFNRERLDAFNEVARICPAAASALLRPSPCARNKFRFGFPEDLDACARKHVHSIDAEWRQILVSGAKNGVLTVDTLTEFVEFSSSAAVDLIDALTDEPEVANKQHQPLPLRAYIPETSALCRMSIAYELDVAWTWCPYSKEHEWHKTFAPADRRAQEVQIRVMKLKGLANLRLIFALARTTNSLLFSKLVIHGLLDFVWIQERAKFVLDMLGTAVATLALSCWILNLPQQSVDTDGLVVSGFLWCVVASNSLTQIVLLAISGVACFKQLDFSYFLHWASVTKLQWATCICTMALAGFTRETLRPSSSDGSILAASSVLHWVELLYNLHAFQWTGKKILPILHSVQPIAGMLVIMAFLMSAITHCFWAMDSQKRKDLASYEVVMFLLTGELFLGVNDLETMDHGSRTWAIFLCIVSVFIFSACALNVFIAVLGDCYDYEQERLVATFFKSRANNCLQLLLRPPFECDGRVARCLLAVMVVTFASLFVFAARGHIGFWCPAVELSVLMVLLQILLTGSTRNDWDKRYMWICNEADVEDCLIIPSESGAIGVESSGRMPRLKRFIFDQFHEIERRNLPQAMLSRGASVTCEKGYKSEESAATWEAVDDLRRELCAEVSKLKNELSGIDDKVACMAAAMERTDNHLRQENGQHRLIELS